MEDLVWVDLAGLNDTGGEFISFVNSFINKKIFHLAAQVKFLLPFTSMQLTDARGKSVRDQIQIIQEVCRSLELDEVIKAVQPVLTKVK